jgi:RNA polymerase sigma-70 factor (ECF subfamily)
MGELVDVDTEIDVELMHRVAAGDEGAFTLLYKRMAPPLYALALRLMTNPKDAEEVLQEAFEYAWRKANQYDPSRSKPLSWMALVLRHKGIDRLRVRRRLEKIEERAKEDIPDLVDDQAGSEPIYRERRALVRSALEQVGPEQRQALELAFFSGFTHEQIAEHLATPLGTIKARIRRGLLKLRECLRTGI